MPADTLKEFELENKVNPEKPAEEIKPEETPKPTPEGEPVVEEKPKGDRPEKNYEAELERKNKKVRDLEEENEALKSQPAKPTPETVDWRQQLETAAASEMAQTGNSMPWNTMMSVMNQMASRTINTTAGTKDEAGKSVRSFKRSIRKDPDFADIEDEFDELVDQLKPGQVNPQVLEICLNSVRGKKVADIKKAAYEEGRKAAEKDTEIVGPTDTGTHSISTGATNLTSAQQEELNGLNENTEITYTVPEYLKMINNKKARFKVAGAKNEPQLMKDVMIK